MIDESLFLYKIKLLCTDNDERISFYLGAIDFDDALALVRENYHQPNYFIIGIKEIGGLSIRSAQPCMEPTGATDAAPNHE